MIHFNKLDQNIRLNYLYISPISYFENEIFYRLINLVGLSIPISKYKDNLISEVPTF